MESPDKNDALSPSKLRSTNTESGFTDLTDSVNPSENEEYRGSYLAGDNANTANLYYAP